MIAPELKRQREAAEDAAFAAQIAASQRVLTMLRAEVDEMKAALAGRRLEEAKYSPSQPRVPAGNPRGGQWTDRSGGQSTGTTLALAEERFEWMARGTTFPALLSTGFGD